MVRPFEDRLLKSYKIFEAHTGSPIKSQSARIDVGMQAAWLHLIEMEMESHGGIDLRGIVGGLGNGVAGIMHSLVLSEKKLQGDTASEKLRSVLLDVLREVSEDVMAPVPHDQMVQPEPTLKARKT